jgi:hypothetical protein
MSSALLHVPVAVTRSLVYDGVRVDLVGLTPLAIRVGPMGWSNAANL